MKVKELIEKLEGYEDYTINIVGLDIDDGDEFIDIILDYDLEYDEDCYDCENDDDCENCEEKDFCRNNPDNSWKYSNYEDKDIGDWDVDDHLASWYDHMMEK